MEDDLQKVLNEQAAQLVHKIHQAVVEGNINPAVIVACLSTIECRMALSVSMTKESWLDEKSTLWDELQKEHSELLKSKELPEDQVV